MARSAAGVWRAVACTSLLGMTLAQTAQTYCPPDTCETETPTIYYNCPTPTIPLSGAPTSSPMRVTMPPAPTRNPVVTFAPTGPSASPIRSPSVAPTLEDVAPTEELMPSMAPTTSAPTAAPVPTDEPTERPSSAPRTCECQVKRGVFNMPMPTYTCPTPAPIVNVVLSTDLDSLASIPYIRDLLDKVIKAVSQADVSALLTNALPVNVLTRIPRAPGTTLPELVLKLTASPTLSSTGSGSDAVVAVALEILIDFTTLLANPADYKAALRVWFAGLFDVNPSQVNSIKITAGGVSYKRKAGALSTTPVTITSSICSAANCASTSTFLVPMVPAAAATVWAAASAHAQQTVTLAGVQSVMTVGTNIDVDANGLKMHLTVASAPTMTTAGTIVPIPANAVSFIYRANVNWADVERLGKAMSKAAYIYATALTFSPPLNVNQFQNVMFLPPGEATYGRRAGGLARTTGQISQDILQPGTGTPTPLSVEDDDSSIIAVAVIVPITVIAIVLVIVWYLVCGGDDEKKEVTNPYGNREEVVNPDNVDGEVPEGEAAP